MLTRKIIAIFLFVATLFSLSGCHFSENSVRLASKTEILEYAQRMFGESTYLSSREGDNSIEYSLRDNQYGFEYTIKSFVQPYGMDGSVFGYSEEKSSNFEDMYWNYIYSDLSELIENDMYELGMELELYESMFKECIGAIIINEDVDNETAVKCIEKLAKKISQFDSRGYYQNSEIRLELQDNTYVGSYIFNEQKFKTAQELDIDFHMERAGQILNTNVQYKRMESVKKSDVAGLDDFQIAFVLGSNNDTKDEVVCYYFTSNDKEYFITDVIIEDESYVGQHVYCLTDACSLKKRDN